jgi:aspartate aminotransferase
MHMVAHSATLAINERLAARRAAGERVVHLGFGEAGLPVPGFIAEQLRGAAGRNGYGPVAGSPGVRRAAAGYFTRRGITTQPEQIVTAPGSKALLYALIAALPGDVILPRPSWVSYAAQAALAGKRVHWADIPEEAGGVPDPGALTAAVHAARRAGQRPGVLVLTVPDNPTGTVATAEHVKQVCAIAEEHGLAVISDEIYRDLAAAPASVRSPAEFLPQQCFVTGGLSKSLALGGWRIGFARFPHSDLGERTLDAVIGIASEVWSSLAAPMQDVAAYVLDEPSEVREHVAAGRKLHAAVAQAVYREFVAAGAACRQPTAAFYLYPDLSPLAGLGRHGLAGADAVAGFLLDKHGVGVLSGAAFGDHPDAPRFRVATSLLYGESEEQRWQALSSDAPAELPWVAAALTQLRTALADLR